MAQADTPTKAYRRLQFDNRDDEERRIIPGHEKTTGHTCGRGKNASQGEKCTCGTERTITTSKS
jgi:hypothetical protein